MADVRIARRGPGGGGASSRPAPPRTIPNVRRFDAAAASTASSIAAMSLPSPRSVPLSPVSEGIYGYTKRPSPAPLVLDESAGDRGRSTAEGRAEGSMPAPSGRPASGVAAAAPQLVPLGIKRRPPHNRRPPTQARELPETAANPFANFVGGGAAPHHMLKLSDVEPIAVAAAGIEDDASHVLRTKTSQHHFPRLDDAVESENLDRQHNISSRKLLLADENDRPSVELFQTEADTAASAFPPAALMPQHSSWLAVESVDSTMHAEDRFAEKEGSSSKFGNDGGGLGEHPDDENGDEDDDIQRTAAAMSQCVVASDRRGNVRGGPSGSTSAVGLPQGAMAPSSGALRRSSLAKPPPICTTSLDVFEDAASREEVGGNALQSPRVTSNDKSRPGGAARRSSLQQAWPNIPPTYSTGKPLARQLTFADLVNEHRRRRVSSATFPISGAAAGYGLSDSANGVEASGGDGRKAAAGSTTSAASAANSTPSFAAAVSAAYSKSRRQTAVALHLQPSRRPGEGRRSLMEPFAEPPSLNGSLESHNATEYVAAGDRSGSILHATYHDLASSGAAAARRRSSSSSAARRPSMDTLRAMDLDALREEDAAEETAEPAPRMGGGDVFAPWSIVTPTAASLINATRPSMSIPGIRHMLSVQTTPTRELLPETDESALELMRNNMNVCTLEEHARRAQRGWVCLGVKLSRRLLLICCAVVLVVGGAVLGAVVATRKRKVTQ